MLCFMLRKKCNVFLAKMPFDIRFVGFSKCLMIFFKNIKQSSSQSKVVIIVEKLAEIKKIIALLDVIL